ncbi:hypothetical protein QWT69_16405 [Sporosarcina oncorhynchi]|uniref:Uncharacterized protein n=1 Tax=Sporosarcina oncorhynchi TaxID=3056444 RepID=A0ABZ0L7P2_9BACL|nr:hypothetical protein [Sporosarcina sp. T2O-4]WOV87409.1 hypothetical protein QWT69_16405 [Sporosarcina sp. T2O-4]
MQKLFMKQNPIGYLIKIAGIIVIAWGVLQAIFYVTTMSQMGGEFMDEFGNIEYSTGLSGIAIFSFISIIATHLLYGLLIIGFGEVIDLLQRIYFKLNPEAELEWKTEQAEKETVNGTDVPFWVEKELKRYYEKQQTTFDSIDHTTDAYIFKVTVDGRVEYVEVGNFEPRVLSAEEAKKYNE